MKFQDTPRDSKTCPATAVCRTDDPGCPTSGEGLGETLSPDQNTGPMQGHESARAKAGSEVLSPWHPGFCELLPGRFEDPQAGGCQGVSKQAPAA